MINFSVRYVIVGNADWLNFPLLLLSFLRLILILTLTLSCCDIDVPDIYGCVCMDV